MQPQRTYIGYKFHNFSIQFSLIQKIQHISYIQGGILAWYFIHHILEHIGCLILVLILFVFFCLNRNISTHLFNINQLNNGIMSPIQLHRLMQFNALRLSLVIPSFIDISLQFFSAARCQQVRLCSRANWYRASSASWYSFKWPKGYIDHWWPYRARLVNDWVSVLSRYWIARWVIIPLSHVVYHWLCIVFENIAYHACFFYAFHYHHKKEWKWRKYTEVIFSILSNSLGLGKLRWDTFAETKSWLQRMSLYFCTTWNFDWII